MVLPGVDFGPFIFSVPSVTKKGAKKGAKKGSRKRCKKQVEKIGVSVYAPSELQSIVRRYIIDLVQIPVNIFDQRFLEKNFVADLRIYDAVFIICWGFKDI